MLNLTELRRVARIIEREFAGARVERFVQPDRARVAIMLYVSPRRPGADNGTDPLSGPDSASADGAAAASRSGRRVLELRCDRAVAQIGEASGLPRAPQNPPAFVSYLRSHLSRARLLEVRVLGDDRQLQLRFEAREGRFSLLLSIFGHRSNVYILDAEERILLSLRPLSETRAELAQGEPYRNPDGAGALRAGDDRFASTNDGDLLREIFERQADAASDEHDRTLERSIRQLLKRETKNSKRRLEKVEAELAEADQAGLLQRHGELLKGALGRIESGASSILVNDYETGEAIDIPLDPKLSPRKNLEATFNRYQKLLRRLTKAGGQVEDARAWHEKTVLWSGALEAAQALEADERTAALEALAAEPELSRLLGRAAARSGRASAAPRDTSPALPGRLRDVPAKLRPRRYLSLDGLEIWVGRNDAGNDHLSTRLARGKDLFFHLDGAPGSHVILCTGGNAEPPNESVLDACELAIRFSKQKNAGRADVHVVPIKNVKKPKGAKPGLVYVTGGRSIHLRREPERLERVLATRIDDTR